MNFDEQKVNGTNEINIVDSLNAPLMKIRIERNNDICNVDNNNLIIYVDKNGKESPSSERREFFFKLKEPLKYKNNIGDVFELKFSMEDNRIKLLCNVLRKCNLIEEREEIDALPITLFEGVNYIYTNYDNISLETVYHKNTEFNKNYMTTSLYYAQKASGSDTFCLDDIYFKDAFTKNEEKMDLEVDNATISSLSSKNNKFNLDEDGNLLVNSITVTNKGENNFDFDTIYPIGSIYLSVNNTNPGTMFGGIWEQIKDKFLLASGDNYTNGTTGGEASHILTVGEMPRHNHIFSQTSCSNSGDHTHVVGADKDGGAGSNRYTVHITSNNTAIGQGFSPISGGAGNHTHSITGNISEKGDNLSHNNMPPYLAVCIWHRIA